MLQYTVSLASLLMGSPKISRGRARPGGSAVVNQAARLVAASRPCGLLSPRLRAPLASDALTPSHWLSHSSANSIEIWSLHNLQYGTFYA